MNGGIGSAASVDDAELIARAQKASDTATRDALLEELYSRHYPKVARWCLRFSGSEDAAADLAQECFLRAHRGLAEFKSQCKFSTWLYTIVRRTAINRSQKAEVQRSRQLEDKDVRALESTEQPAEDLYATKEAVASLLDKTRTILDDRERDVLRLRFGAGLSLPEIGRLLKFENQSGAKAYLQSAMRKLRRAMAEGDHAAQFKSEENGGAP